MIDYTPQELGFRFEKKCRTILSQFSNAIVLKESEVKKRFGAATSSVDIYAEINNNIFSSSRFISLTLKLVIVFIFLLFT